MRVIKIDPIKKEITEFDTNSAPKDVQVLMGMLNDSQSEIIGIDPELVLVYRKNANGKFGFWGIDKTHNGVAYIVGKTRKNTLKSVTEKLDNIKMIVEWR